MQLSKSLKLPNEVASQAIAIFGTRGSGKTNTASVIVEELLDIGQPLCIIDPTDAWWGLQSSATGTKSGYPVLICGGHHGQLPLTERDGPTMAAFIVQEQVPCVLSIRHLKKAPQRRFFAEFAEELYHLKGEPKYRTPLTVVVDETPLFAPQMSNLGDTGKSLGAMEDLIFRGRNAGFGVISISLRPALVNKNITDLCDTIITHRMTGPRDRKAFKEWIDSNATIDEVGSVLESLAQLDAGEAWIWSPPLNIIQRTQVRLRRTFDSSFTPTVGKMQAAPKKLATVDLATLKGKLAASIEKAKADDPAELRKRIAELEKLVAQKFPANVSPGPPDQKTIDRAVVAAVNARDGEWKPVKDVLIDATKKLEKIRELANPLIALIPLPYKQLALADTVPPAANLPEKKVPARSPAVPGGDLPKAEQALLQACFWTKDETPTKSKLSFYSGYSAASSSFDKALSNLRGRGLVEGLKITDAGQAAVGYAGAKPNGPELREFLRGRLGKAENALLDVLIAVYPRRLDKAELGAAAGYSPISSSFDKAASTLWTIEAANGGSREGMQAASIFVEG